MGDIKSLRKEFAAYARGATAAGEAIDRLLSGEDFPPEGVSSHGAAVDWLNSLRKRLHDMELVADAVGEAIG